MKGKEQLLLILLPLTLGLGQLHDYYLSTTSFQWRPEKNQIQLTSRFFIDDIEALMQKSVQKNMVLAPDSHPEESNRFVKTFYLKNLSVKSDDTVETIQYLGHEYQEDLLVIYAEIIPQISEISSFTITTTFLIDFLDNQQNILHIVTPNQKKSYLMSRSKRQIEFRFADKKK